MVEAILGTIIFVLFAFLIRNVHQNAVEVADLKAKLKQCQCITP